MGVMTRLRRMMGGESTTDEATIDDKGEPSHVCQSCGEEYFTDRAYEIDTCRSCGGIKVEST